MSLALRVAGLAALVLSCAARTTAAQTPMPGMPRDMPAEASGWHWTPAANLFVEQNDQFRKFTDFHAFESFNWFMLDGRHAAGSGTVQVTGMISLEPLTLRRLGSPQVFQTGETLDGAPLIDYQHPHDFLMQLGMRYERPVGAATVHMGAYVAGEPTIGPMAFMHRVSAAINPQVPLGHHHLDSTHITPGVLSAGVTRGAVGIEASWFRGREPDEHRWDLDLGRLDSWAVRGTWTHQAWSAQVSGAHLTRPDVLEPYDMGRLTASLSYTREMGAHPLAVTMAWGQNREFYGHFNTSLVEAVWRARPRWQLYTRGEVVMKEILTAGGFVPAGVFEPHVYSRIGALTAGAERDLTTTHGMRVGLGADVTGYYVPANLRDSYGSPWSMHVFLQIGVGTAHHMH